MMARYASDRTVHARPIEITATVRLKFPRRTNLRRILQGQCIIDARETEDRTNFGRIEHRKF